MSTRAYLRQHEHPRAYTSIAVPLQDAERSRFVVMKAEQEAKASIIRAEGEGEAAELISKALKDSGSAMIDVKRIDAAKEIAEALASSRNVIYVPQGMNMLMSMPTPRPAPIAAPLN